jgi:hypothetical protein
MHNTIERTKSPAQACVERLRSLPTETHPPYNWQEFQRRSQLRLPAANDGVNWRHMAAAAAVLLFVCAIAIWGRVGGNGRHVIAESGAVEDGTAGWTHDARNAKDFVMARPSSDDIVTRATEGQAAGATEGQAAGATEGTANGIVADEDLPRGAAAGESTLTANRSRAIESWLATLPREPAVVRVGTRAAVAGLEDRIAQVDDLMTSVRIDGMRPDRLAALQQERLRLVGSLAQVRYAEVVASESP